MAVAGLADLAGAALPALRELGRRESAGAARDGHVLERVVAIAPSLLEPLGAAHHALVGHEQPARIRIQHCIDAARDFASVRGVEPCVIARDVADVGEPLEADGVVLGVAAVDVGQRHTPRDACRPGVGWSVDDTGDRVAPRSEERVARQVRPFRGEPDALAHSTSTDSPSRHWRNTRYRPCSAPRSWLPNPSNVPS